jgi:hypothetical protein
VTTYRTVDLPGGGTADVADTDLAYEIPDGLITLHRNKMASRTIEYWKTKDVFCALRDIVGDEIQEIENRQWDVLASKDIDRAFGQSIDLIGRIVGEARDGRADPGFRVRVKAREVINRSQGRTNDVLTMLRLLDPATFTITDTPPAAFVVTMSAAPSGAATSTEMASLVGECRAAGIGAFVEMPVGTGFILADTVGATITGSSLGDTVGATVPLAHLPDVRTA